jgi:hypothetical protein
MNRVLKKNEIDKLLSPSRGKFSWLNTKNSRRVYEAIRDNKETVALEGLSWPVFKIRFHPDNKRQIYISPTGLGAPFTPCCWLNLDKLEQEVGD